jgi:DNA topoisomerase I
VPSRSSQVPPVPDLGDGKVHKWGEVVHKNTVTWLAKWKDSINGEDKCVWLAANSSWKGMSDMAKYEKARLLKQHIGKVRKDYAEGMKHGDLTAQQKSVAVYLIDRLALRVGNEKNTDEEADTVGCCSLRVEHVKDDAGENMLHLNFLGKDSIVYDNTNPIEPIVYQMIKKFMKGKKPTEELFDKVEPDDLNDYFKSVMEGLSAKVFRTYNASITLCSELAKTDVEVTAEKREKEGDVNALCSWYNTANKNVAILCNHQKAASASHGTTMAKIDEKIEKVTEELKEAKKAKSSKVDALQKRLVKLQTERQTKDDLKNVSLGTSKINYNDPRITIAWCKRFDVPIQKQFPKTLLAKFAWAMETPPDFKF